MSDDVRDEFVRGWEDAGRGVKFREHESRPWKNGWRLFDLREAQRRALGVHPVLLWSSALSGLGSRLQRDPRPDVKPDTAR
jgi:hypothetical protein